MKVSYLQARVQSISLHKVGNKMTHEGIKLSKNCLNVQDDIKQILLQFFVGSFQTEETYRFFHDNDLSLNEVYHICSEIFAAPDKIHPQSIHLARHLYNKSTHPKIKIGEFYVVYFRNCLIEHQLVDAIGLFKTENKDTFLKIYPKGDDFEIESDKGINIKKLDKGCLVFNLEKEKGYVINIVDNTNKGIDAKYWTDEFLHICPRKDNYQQTQLMLSLCTSFVSQLPNEEGGKAQKATLINESLKALNEPSVNVQQFAQNVFQKPELISQFHEYKKNYQQERQVELDDTFQPNITALKRKTRGCMTTIKLDRHFDIQIHGGEKYIERGYDESRGLHYYKLFFKEEK